MTNPTEAQGDPGTRPISPASDGYVAAFLEELAPSFDEWAGGLHARLAQRLVALAEPAPGEACLDIGTGTGLVAEMVSDLVGPSGSVVSIDLNERMLEVARGRRRDNTRFMAMPIDDVVFRGETFDLVTVGRSLAYMIQPAHVLREARRILRPGGRLALFCRRRSLSTPAESVFFAVLVRLLARHPIRPPEQFPEQSHLGERADLEALLAASGFESEKFADMVTGGHAADARQWNDLMMQSWPAARFTVGALGPDARLAFDAEVAAAMATLDEDAFRYHHPYLFAVAKKAP